jgi:large subunit ribosomal protein L15
MPLHRRIPKRGFTNIFRTDFAVLNVDRLNDFPAGTVVTPELLLERGIVSQRSRPVKILGDGELKAALTVRVHAFSKSAEQKIAGAGGRVERL